MAAPMFDFRPAHPDDLKPVLYTIGHDPNLPTKAMIEHGDIPQEMIKAKLS